MLSHEMCWCRVSASNCLLHVFHACVQHSVFNSDTDSQYVRQHHILQTVSLIGRLVALPTGFSTVQLQMSSSVINTRFMVKSFWSGDNTNLVSLVRGFPPLNHLYVVLVPFSCEQLRTMFSLSSSTDEASTWM